MWGTAEGREMWMEGRMIDRTTHSVGQGVLVWRVRGEHVRGEKGRRRAGVEGGARSRRKGYAERRPTGVGAKAPPGCMNCHIHACARVQTSTTNKSSESARKRKDQRANTEASGGKGAKKGRVLEAVPHTIKAGSGEHMCFERLATAVSSKSFHRGEGGCLHISLG